ALAALLRFSAARHSRAGARAVGARRGGMKTTLSWLKSHLDTDAPIAALAERLVMLGHDVDGIDDRAGALDGFVVARVVSAEPHPNADRLRVCVVDHGGSETQVVCGAPHPRAGLTGLSG